ncbi:hypothetical protein Tco_1344845 [Tanacetum coccineum]
MKILETAFMENYLQQTKHIKDPVEIHHIKQRDGESTEDFMERYKAEGEVACTQSRPQEKHHHGNHRGTDKPISRKAQNKTKTGSEARIDSHSHQNSQRNFAARAEKKGKVQSPTPMVTPVEKRDPNKYCKISLDTGHSTRLECMQLRKQIDEMIKAGKLSQFIKELKQNVDIEDL